MSKKIKLLKNHNSKYSLGEIVSINIDNYYPKITLNKAGRNFFKKQVALKTYSYDRK